MLSIYPFDSQQRNYFALRRFQSQNGSNTKSSIERSMRGDSQSCISQACPSHGRVAIIGASHRRASHKYVSNRHAPHRRASYRRASYEHASLAGTYLPPPQSLRPLTALVPAPVPARAPTRPLLHRPSRLLNLRQLPF